MGGPRPAGSSSSSARRSSGAEHVPADGPAILASNHLSYADWLFMPLTLPRRVTFVAKAEYFTTPGIKGWFQKKFFSGAGQVPIDRSGAERRRGRALRGQADPRARATCSASTPRAPAPTTASSTAARPAWPGWRSSASVPVIPVAVVGTDVVAPPGKTFGKFTRPIVRFGKPLDFSRYEGMENDRYILRSITDEIMYEIMRLSGPGVRRHVRRPGQGGVQEAAEAQAAPTAASGDEQKKAS